MKDKGVHDSSQSDDNNEALKRSPSSVVPSFSIPGELRNKFHVDLVVCFYLVTVLKGYIPMHASIRQHLVSQEV